jgi:hypothetical protein
MPRETKVIVPWKGVKMATKKRIAAIAEFMELKKRGLRDNGRKRPYVRFRMTCKQN